MYGTFKGLIPAAFSPMKSDGSINPGAVKSITEKLINDGIDGILVNGSTGEYSSLTIDERLELATAYVEAVAGRVPVMIHVGDNSLRNAASLAAHAEELGVEAILCAPPSYFKPRDVPAVVDCLCEVAAAAPKTPFYYYHIPVLTGVNVSPSQLLQLACEKLPAFAGIKFTDENIMEFHRCLDLGSDKLDIFAGRDEILLSFLAVGATGAIGSTYNYTTPIFRKLWNAYDSGDMAEAQKWQKRAVDIIGILQRYGGGAASKAIMRQLCPEVGPARLPHRQLNAAEDREIASELTGMGFLGWLGL